MRRRMRGVVTAAAAMIVLSGMVVLSGFRIESLQSSASQDATAKPLLLEKDEGELRTRRIHTDASAPASSQFMLKVSPKNNGSQHLIAGTEVVNPGATLP